jgi:hypothetical protein
MTARFFPPKYIDNIGFFQDPGPLENDPILLARSELAALFPSINQPNYIISLGTGELVDEKILPQPKGLLRNGALPRLFRMFWESMRGENLRQTFQNDPRYHRVDVKFKSGEEPMLDDISSIPYLNSKARNDPTVFGVVEEIAKCFIASLFYFELESLPQKVGGRYSGHGQLLCLLNSHELAFHELFDQLSQVSARLYLDGHLIALVNDISCFNKGGGFRKRVAFDDKGKFAIYLERGSERHHISGSPFSVENLVQLQGLNANFGRPDHQKRREKKRKRRENV